MGLSLVYIPSTRVAQFYIFTFFVNLKEDVEVMKATKCVNNVHYFSNFNLYTSQKNYEPNKCFKIKSEEHKLW